MTKKILITFRQKVGLLNKVRIRKGSRIIELEKVLGEIEKVQAPT